MHTRWPSLALWLLIAGCHPMRSIEPSRTDPTATRPPPTSRSTAPVACRPDRDQSLAVDPQRQRRCVIDVGSRNVKLVVTAVKDNDPSSLTGERVCRSRLQLGEKTFDQKAQSGRPLASAEQDTLALLLADYAALCARDGGQVVGAIATEWARRATNPDEIRRTVAARTGLDLAILSSDREARLGYLAATHGARGKMVLDFGSRSFQLSYWPRGAADPSAASVPLGIDEAGDRFFGKSEYHDYASARAAFVAAFRAGLGATLPRMRSAMRSGALGPELFSLGENGDVPLGLEGKLWEPATHRGVDEARYSALLKARAPITSASFGTVTGIVSARELAVLARTVEHDPALFEELRSDRVKRIYGYKILAVPAVVGALAEDLGIETMVLVPQEMPDGLIVDHLRP
jgi:hypothetical protein